jgi:hypothetical protein
MLRKNVPTNLTMMLVILQVSVSEEVGYIFWNVSTRLQVKDKSICVDGVNKLSGIEI